VTYRIKRVDAFDDEIADTLRELHEEIFADTAPQVDPEWGWFWLAYAVDEGRDIAGFCQLSPTINQPSSMAYLRRAGVRLRHRGRGLQRRMVRVREAHARRLRYRAIVTDTTDNPSSANNLIACGYRIYEPQEPWGFNNTIYWKKDLTT
jgi:GNAT superfamily N-acetyltransferase